MAFTFACIMTQKFYFFIDESGDPNFYGRHHRPLWLEPDFEPVLMLGMVVVRNRRWLREQVISFQQKILADPLYSSIYSVSQPAWFLHASKDHSDVRLKFFEMLRDLEGLEVYIVIGRKLPDLFHAKHNKKASEFYFDLLNKLLTRFNFDPGRQCQLYLSQRQSNTMERFEEALEKALVVQSKRFDANLFNCRITPSRDYPELSVIDYFLWALKRYITVGEKRFFTALEKHVKEVYDVYEEEGKGKLYNATDPFDLSKASPFSIK